jgi:hypothetical protein
MRIGGLKSMLCHFSTRRALDSGLMNDRRMVSLVTAASPSATMASWSLPGETLMATTLSIFFVAVATTHDLPTPIGPITTM